MTEINIPSQAYEAGERAVIAYDLVTQSDAYDIASDVLRVSAPSILAAELDRLVQDPGSYDDAGNFRPVVLVNRASELRKAGEQS